MDAPTKLLAAGAVGALAAANALHPLATGGTASFASFAAGAVTSEIPLIHAAAHGLVATGLA
ncbi:MAG TPA: hypothetical protein VGP53_08505, partial [Acidimicrobiales bacterium]|nr:hypothetical protein [Acidimicrobiales bacterium]